MLEECIGRSGGCVRGIGRERRGVTGGGILELVDRGCCFRCC